MMANSYTHTRSLLRLWGPQISSLFKSRNTIYNNSYRLFSNIENKLGRYTRHFKTNTISAQFHSKNISNFDNSDEELIHDEDSDPQEKELYNELVHRMHLLPDGGHQVLVIQPFVKWGPKKKELTSPDLMLDEALGLIDSLPNWKCVETIKVPVETLEKKNVFGTGQLENLQKQIRRNPQVSAVFVSLNLLRGIQRKELVSAFGVPVYDRYSIVLQIFKERAKTKEAKLQVALAEVPYLRSCLVGLIKGRSSSADSPGMASTGNLGESYYDRQLHVLERRELKVKRELEALSKKRVLLKTERKRKEFPVVAVVGYTNAGKSTLIKSLSGDNKIEPRDALFATLDVTVHACKLPCNLTVLLTDTVGFISDIPTNLIAAFNATLRDAIDADLIIHIHDESHPDLVNQIATVNETLKQLELSDSKPIIRVANKVDKLPSGSVYKEADLGISAVNGLGLSHLLEIIQSRIIKITNRCVVRIMVRNGGYEYSWILKETVVVNCITSETSENVILDILVTKSTLGKIKSNFPTMKFFNKINTR